ncbi:MAG: class II fructose-bisphosphate aldolase [Candidatus Kaelpia aquatica]|nr:class II fructose-bisphosphate aldolase [Candidatus Kaelpia aquatica]
MSELKMSIAGVRFEGGSLVIEDEGVLMAEGIDKLLESIIFEDDIKKKAGYAAVIWELAGQSGIYPASIHDLYKAIGRGEASGFTVPAMNLRTLTYDTARAVFRAAGKIDAAAFIFEIARSEMGYTGQRPLEYTAVCLAAAIKEGYKGCVFVQGDHFQVKLSDFQTNKEKALSEIKKFISESIQGGFYNIDIDASTLVDLSKEVLDEQQEHNCWVTSELTKYIRSQEIEGVTVSIGGEIGEVGSKNSTSEDLNAFMKGYLELLEGSCEGISKISIQTGTTHGGVVLPDGSVAEVKVDFDTLKELSEISKKSYEMAGAVQHGASTLPKEAFNKFPETAAAEIHLATQFQNIIYDNMPSDLKTEIYDWLKENFKSDWKEGQTEEQFLYKVRKQALGNFKQKIHCVDKNIKNDIASKLEEEFDFLFKQLNIKGTKEAVGKFIKPAAIKKQAKDLLPQEFVDANFDGAD